MERGTAATLAAQVAAATASGPAIVMVGDALRPAFHIADGDDAAEAWPDTALAGSAAFSHGGRQRLCPVSGPGLPATPATISIPLGRLESEASTNGSEDVALDHLGPWSRVQDGRPDMRNLG